MLTAFGTNLIFEWIWTNDVYMQDMRNYDDVKRASMANR